jgi:uncharacterized protein (TIRG00374 family)
MTAWRFAILAGEARLGSTESVRLILAASTLNLFLPSKMGDLAKAYVLSNQHGMDGRLALSITILEKALDLASLLFLGVFALIYVAAPNSLLWFFSFVIAVLFLILVAMILPYGLLPAASRLIVGIVPTPVGQEVTRFAEAWQRVVRWYWSVPRIAIAVLLLSVAIWGLHLMQFWVFAQAIGAQIPISQNMAFATLAILAGLVPFTVAGIGTRDAALIHFYGAYLEPGAGAFLGILATLRYVIPAIAGLPFVGGYAQMGGRTHLGP